MSSKARRRMQKPKPVQWRDTVALDALGLTEGNRRKTRFDNDSKRQGTRYGQLQAAMSE